MAFVPIIARSTSASASRTTPQNSNVNRARQPSRRSFSVAAARLLIASAVLPITTFEEPARAQESGQLPDGAKQFSQVISAQRQWNSVIDAFSDGRVPEDAEWDNLRTYLRAVYAVSSDMDFLTRRWDKSRKETGLKVISTFRNAVKAMDKPAIRKDIPAFLEGHAQVVGLFNDYFAILKQDTVGDMPDEL